MPLFSPTSPIAINPSPYPSVRQHSLHHRTMSQSSTGSSFSAKSSGSSGGPTPTMEHLMRVIAQAPRGSKIAQDASRALLIAEKERFHRTGVPLSRAGSNASDPAPSSPGSSHGHGRNDSIDALLTSPKTAPRPETVGPGARIGGAMLSPPLADLTEVEDDPFALDVPEEAVQDDHLAPLVPQRPAQAFYADPHGTPQWPAIPSYPPTPPVRSASLKDTARNPMVSGADADALRRGLAAVPTGGFLPTMMREVPAAQPAVAIYWRGSHQQRFAFVTNNSGTQGTDDVFPVLVAPRHTQVVEVPPSWAGYVRKCDDGPTTPYTAAHLAFQDQLPFNFFYVSHIEGNNGPVVMVSEPSGNTAGCRFRAADVSPASITHTDDASRRYVVGTSQGSSERRAAVRAFYDNFYYKPQFGAIIAADTPQATQVTRDRHIVIDFCG